MDEEDKKIKAFVSSDKKIPEKVNKTFDSFIEQVEKNQILENDVIDENNGTQFLLRFRKILAVAASFLIIAVGSNVYAKSQGYENIFFLIKNIIYNEEKTDDEIFSDKDIVISYKSIQITDEIELQINELQIKDNTAKLYLLVKEQKENLDSPLNYKVYNNENLEMYSSKNNKKHEENIYTEVLNLKNYKDSCTKLKLEIYNNNGVLLKSIIIDLLEKTIEARTENQVINKISQIELNKFIKNETEKLYSKDEMKNKKVIIIDIYDIFYSNGKYIVKYIFMMPSDEEFEKDKVQETTIYTNTIEFTSNNEDFIKVKIDTPEVFE